MTIDWQTFQQVELRVGTIIEASVFKEAIKPALLLKVDFGTEIGIKKSSAQITEHYQPEQLIGKQVIAVTNFPPKQIGPIMSECLVTGFHDQNNHVKLAIPDGQIPNGTRLA